MDIFTKYLSIELSRKCNLSCRHCLRGNSQNISINSDTLNKVFNEVKGVNSLVLAGGEPFLCYEEIKMLCEIINNYHVNINNVIIVTNGTVYDERIYKLLSKYYNYIKVNISMDKYHDEAINKFNKKDQKIMLENMLKHKELKYFNSYYFMQKYLINGGRAKYLDEPKKDYDILGYFYTILNNKLYVGPEIYVDALGYICDGNSEYDLRNIYSIGNINNNTLNDMVIKNAKKFNTSTIEGAYCYFNNRIDEYQKYQGDIYEYKDNKIVRKLEK